MKSLAALVGVLGVSAAALYCSDSVPPRWSPWLLAHAALPPAATPDYTDPGPRLAGFAAELEESTACLERTDCNFPADAYRAAVGENLRAILLEMREYAVANKLRDDRISSLASLYLNVSIEPVQEAALELLSTQPLREDSLPAVLHEATEGADAHLVQDALRELTRFERDDDRTRIASALADALTTGSPVAAREISAGIRPFLRYTSGVDFAGAIESLPPDSEIRANVEKTLREFHGAHAAR
jgi:hypothetical protein